MVKIKYLISSKAYKGSVGKRKKKTDENIKTIGEYLLKVESKEEIIKQLRKNKKRCARLQYLCGLGIVADLAVGGPLLWLASKTENDFLKYCGTAGVGAVAAVLTGTLGSLYKREYLYDGIINYLENQNKVGLPHKDKKGVSFEIESKKYLDV